MTSSINIQPGLFVPIKQFPQPPRTLDSETQKYLSKIIELFRTNDLAIQTFINRSDQSAFTSAGSTSLTAGSWTNLVGFATSGAAYKDSGKGPGALLQNNVFVAPFSGRYVIELSGFFTFSNPPVGPDTEQCGIRVRCIGDSNPPEIVIPLTMPDAASFPPTLSYTRIWNAAKGDTATPQAFYTDSTAHGMTATFSPTFGIYLIGRPTTNVQ